MTQDIHDEGSLYAEERARTLKKEPYKDNTSWGDDKPAKPAKQGKETKQ